MPLLQGVTNDTQAEEVRELLRAIQRASPDADATWLCTELVCFDSRAKNKWLKQHGKMVKGDDPYCTTFSGFYSNTKGGMEARLAMVFHPYKDGMQWHAIGVLVTSGKKEKDSKSYITDSRSNLTATDSCRAKSFILLGFERRPRD